MFERGFVFPFFLSIGGLGFGFIGWYVVIATDTFALEGTLHTPLQEKHFGDFVKLTKTREFMSNGEHFGRPCFEGERRPFVVGRTIDVQRDSI